MRTNYFLFVMAIILFVACKKTEELTPKETKAMINGEKFTPTKTSARKSGNKLVISFEDGTKKVEVVTNDTINGTYNIVSQSLKSASILKANITFTNGSNTYTGIKGSVEIVSNPGFISGVYNATVQGNGSNIDISSGSFADIPVVTTIPLIETEAAINDTLSLCYSKLYNYVEFSFLFDAVYSNSITAPAGWSEIYNHTQTLNVNNSKILMLWSNAYNIIYKTNHIIKSSEIVIADQEIQTKIISQAKAIRAYLFYQLMIWFGEIPLEQGISESMIPRNNITEVLSKIQSDATEASQGLPLTWAASDKFRIPLSFAKGLLARTYLTDFGLQSTYPTPKPYLYGSNYTAAISVTQQIINTGVYALQSNADNFSTTGTEIIWGFEKGNNTEFSQVFTKGTYVPVMRLTEIDLILSEALFQYGNVSNVLSLINQINTRRGNSIVTFVTPEDIYIHWNTELKLEGSIFLAQKRFNKALAVVQNKPAKILLPIPQSVIEKNPYLTQNVGY
jgi:hypothetical protein